MKRSYPSALSFPILVCLFVFLFGHQSLACTTFCLKHNGEILFGKNYDWMVGDGLILVNKRGMEKTAISQGANNSAKIYFRTLQSPQIKVIEATVFDYSCYRPVKIFDINSKDGGDVTTRFTDYARSANRDLIGRAFSGTEFLKGASAQERDLAASYPESFTCKSP